MFARQIGRNVQVYVNDMLVKSRREDDHLEDLKETFDTFRSYNKKLNPAVSPASVRAALVREDDKVQRPIYYASWALHGAEERYLPMEKLAFTLVTAALKLKPYFQAHTVIVLTNKLLWRATSSPEAAGRMALWAIKLSKFDIQCCPPTAIKGQVVSDFTVEFTNAEGPGVGEYPQWNIYMDRSSNRQAGGLGIVLRSPEGDEIECMVRLDFPTTNNEAEYEALVARLDLAKAARTANVIIHCDSQVITNQINGDYECKGERMKKYLEQVKRRVNKLHAKIVQILRGENEQADCLAKAASAEYMITPDKVEAEAIATITEKNILSFVWKSIIYRYGIPRFLVSNNGKQFDNDSFRDLLTDRD
ncbi:uncharacterized protein LOC142628851 [Castanea sativa]|uniref:uncharacterized protein LOC142628851 n=1 Tax=Castanea sativa TaxID=21020 RepID=UPI003F654982